MTSSARAFLGVVLAVPLLAASYQPVHEYDPNRDATADVRDAAAEAARTNRRVLVEVGGKWCSWCRTLDKFFGDRPELLALRDKNYVLVKVNFSEENKNEALLKKYPEIPGYPHIFVLDENGKLLQSQDTSPLESGKSYDEGRIREFLLRWAPPAQ